MPKKHINSLSPLIINYSGFTRNPRDTSVPKRLTVQKKLQNRQLWEDIVHRRSSLTRTLMEESKFSSPRGFDCM